MFCCFTVVGYIYIIYLKKADVYIFTSKVFVILFQIEQI